MRWSSARFLLLFAIFVTPLCSAQNATGRIIGTLYDPQGAVIAGVEVKATNTATQISRTSTTDNDGYYQILALPIGSYTVAAVHAGFRDVTTAEQKLSINQALRIDIKMEVGATTQRIEVAAQASEVETVNATLGQSVTGRTLTDLPLNGRDTLDLALLQPGVTESNDDNTGAGNYSIAGGRTDSVTFLLDGGINNDLLDNSNFIDPNPDAIAEFRLLSSNYTAEYGRNGGGIISTVVKSGSNQIHGSVFEFFRNRVLDANDYFNIQQQLPRLDLKRNQYGATLGGPLKKDKAFFFLAFQGERQVQAVPVVDSPAFTPQELQGDFSNSGSPDQGVVAFLQANPYFQSDPSKAAQGIIDPTKINSVAQNYIKAGLIPTSPTGTLSSAQNEILNNDELTGKFDFNLNAKDKITLTESVNRNFHTLQYPFATVPGYPSHTSANYYFTNISYTRSTQPPR